MRVIILLLFIGMFVATPVYLLDCYIMPELVGLKQAYGNLEDLGNTLPADIREATPDIKLPN